MRAGVALLLWGLAVPAWASDATLWLEKGVDTDRARQAAQKLGHADPELRALDDLVDAVQVVGVVDRRIEDLCGGPVELNDWRGRLVQARADLQFLDLSAGLAAFSRLEAELPCLTRRLAPDDVFRFHLSTAELHLVVAESRADDVEVASFHLDEARVAAARAVTAGPDMDAPEATLQAATDLLDAVRADARDAAPARVVVVGDAALVYDNGNPAEATPPARGSAPGRGHSLDVPAGTHVFQLSDPGDAAVVAVQLAELPPGSAAVVWARPDAAPMGRSELRAAVRTLATTGRAPVGLGPSLLALSGGGPAYVVTRDGERIRLWGADGQQVRLRLADPPVGRTAADTRAPRHGSPGTKGDLAMHLGLIGGLLDAPPTAPGAGLEVGGRVGLAVPVVLTVALDVAADRLPGVVEDWTGTGRVGLHGGLRLRPRSRLADLGVEGGVLAPVGHALADDARTLHGSVRGIGSLRLPPDSLVGLRLSAWGGLVTPGGWQAGGGLAVELLRDP